MDKDLKNLVNRLERIFPNLKLYCEGETLNISDIEDDFAPPMEYSWYDIIEILRDNGLEITNIKY
jgi:hypothetical protein